MDLTKKKCYSGAESQSFIEEDDMDDSCIEKILSNKFMDPLISSESEDNSDEKHIDWDSVFKPKDNNSEKRHQLYIPGLRPVPLYPKLSSLTAKQHYLLLKVICARHPSILEQECIPRPMKGDYRVFEELKEQYEIEKKEYKQWAHTMWTGGHNIRALRPKPVIENIYKAEFKMKMAVIQILPKNYEFAVQIPLTSTDTKCQMNMVKELIKVNMAEIPQVQVNNRMSIIRPMTAPEPCERHPCQFVLPNESCVSELLVPELHRELGQFAAEHGCTVVASEAALRCITRHHTPWALPLTVCSVVDDDGEEQYVVVMGNDFSLTKESSQTRTYRAFRHLLRQALIPTEERRRILDLMNKKSASSSKVPSESKKPDEKMDCHNDDSEDEGNLVIDEDKPENMETDKDNKAGSDAESKKMGKSNDGQKSNNTVASPGKIKNAYTCTCEESIFERPAPRSYKKWEMKSSNPAETFQMVVHCSHKTKGKSHELIVEPLPEYQVDLGASEIARDTWTSLALALMLRKNASILLSRVDAPTGDVVTTEYLTLDDILANHPDVVNEVRTSLHAALSPLLLLRPGKYILTHNVKHGPNAMLYVASTRMSRNASDRFELRFDIEKEVDEAASLVPPVICDSLLPMHKFRKILPCAYTPHLWHMPRDNKKPQTAARPPPALRWPKRKRRKKKNGGNR